MTVHISKADSNSAVAFANLWLPWVEKLTGKPPEPEDLQVMNDPFSYYTALNGIFFIASLNKRIVGGVGIKRLSQNNYEFGKLLVDEAARGHSIGKKLVQACIDYVTDQGGGMLYLQSFKKLDVALVIYQNMGFQPAKPPPHEMNVLKRTEIIMCRDCFSEAQAMQAVR